MSQAPGQVCPAEPEAVGLVIPRLRNIDIHRLSGGATTAAAVARAEGEPSSCYSCLCGPVWSAVRASALMHPEPIWYPLDRYDARLIAYVGRPAPSNTALVPADSLTRKNTDEHVDAARARFLQRKAARPAGRRK